MATAVAEVYATIVATTCCTNSNADATAVDMNYGRSCGHHFGFGENRNGPSGVCGSKQFASNYIAAVDIAVASVRGRRRCLFHSLNSNANTNTHTHTYTLILLGFLS